jgi:hypothetical protein
LPWNDALIQQFISALPNLQHFNIIDRYVDMVGSRSSKA